MATTQLREALVEAGVACRKIRYATPAEAEAAVESILWNARDTDPTRPFNVWRCPRCRGWHVGHMRLEAGVTTDHDQLREAVAALPPHKAVVVVGGKRGMYAAWVHRHPRVFHVESTESGGRWEATFELPTGSGVVVLSKFGSAALLKRLMRDCKATGVPCFGVYNSPGAVNRALAYAFDVTSPDDAPPPPPPVSAHDLADPAYAPPARPAAPEPDDDEANLLRVFDEAVAALELARETALATLRGARRAAEDSAKLRRLAALLKEVGVGE